MANGGSGISGAAVMAKTGEKQHGVAAARRHGGMARQV
jgi:hypothetical protein